MLDSRYKRTSTDQIDLVRERNKIPEISRNVNQYASILAKKSLIFMSFRPYLAGFRLALSQELVHRSNFLIGRLRDFILFAALIFLFQHVPQGVQNWDQHELLTYTLISAFISTQLSAQAMHTIANEITDGDLTNFLLRPFNYLGYWTARLTAVRLLAFIGGLASVALLLVLFPGIRLALPQDLETWIIGGALLLGSIILMQLIDFMAGLLSFWTNRAYGPRFLIWILVQFMSGAFLPIDAFPEWAQSLLSFTPFPSLIFAPIKTFIRGVDPNTLSILSTQLFWITFLGALLFILWKKGIKKYAAYGR